MSIKYICNNGNITVTGLSDYSLAKTFDCGQCFRFEMINENTVAGVAFGKYIEISQPDESTLVLYNVTETDFESTWRSFLAIDEDYRKIDADVTARFAKMNTDVMERSIEFGKGIRILHQDMWEAVCSFIISQNNNIPRIKGIIRNMSREYGEAIEVKSADGSVRTEYAFPSAKALYDAGIDKIAALRVGFRAKYIFDACEKVVNGTLDLEKIYQMSTPDALTALMSVKGIGLKVASCALLFGFDKYDVFPIDVWIKRIVAKYFPDGLNVEDLGEYAGIAQQYLFYYVRYINPNLE